MAVHDQEVLRLAEKVIELLGETPEQAEQALRQGNYTQRMVDRAARDLGIIFRDQARRLYVIGAVRDRIAIVLRKRKQVAQTPVAGKTAHTPARKTRIEYTLPPGDRE